MLGEHPRFATTDTVSWYRKMARTPRLPAKQTNALAIRAQSNPTPTSQHSYYLRKLEPVMYRTAAQAVLKFARKAGMDPHDMEDLFQVAAAAAFSSLETWDPSKGGFLSYAHNSARYACMNEMSNRSTFIRIPRNLTRHVHNINRGYDTIEHVIERYGFSRQSLEWGLRAIDRTHFTQADQADHSNHVPAHYDEYDDLHRHFDRELIERLRQSANLTFKENQVVEMYLSGRHQTWGDIAFIMGCSRPAAYQKFYRAAQKMRKAYIDTLTSDSPIEAIDILGKPEPSRVEVA